MTALVIGVVLNGCREQGVDEGRLSQAGLTSDLAIKYNVRHLDRATAVRMLVCSRSTYHDGESSTALGDNLVPLVGQVGNAHGASGFGDLRSHIDGGLGRRVWWCMVSRHPCLWCWNGNSRSELIQERRPQLGCQKERVYLRVIKMARRMGELVYNLMAGGKVGYGRTASRCCLPREGIEQTFRLTGKLRGTGRKGVLDSIQYYLKVS